MKGVTRSNDNLNVLQSLNHLGNIVNSFMAPISILIVSIDYRFRYLNKYIVILYTECHV